MTRPILAALVAAMTLTAAQPADAMRRSDNAVSQSRAKLQKEWQRARAVGGNENPIQALMSLFSGKPLTAQQVQPSFTSSTAVDVRGVR